MRLCLFLATASIVAAQPYFPLDPGSRWIYQRNSRFVTGDYLVRRVAGAEVRDGVAWTVIETEGSSNREFFRADPSGRILTLTAAGERVYFTPPANAEGPAVLTIDASLVRERLTFTPGLGLTARENTLLTGSSGGFLEGWRLVEARIGDQIRFRADPTRGELTIAPEFQVLPVSEKKVKNCAVPCYFAACGLAPGADPPDTYKPCLDVRLGADTLRGDYLLLELIDAHGEARLTRDYRVSNDDRDWRRYVSLPLYSKPNEPFVRGDYRLRLTHASGDGVVRGTAESSLWIE